VPWLIDRRRDNRWRLVALNYGADGKSEADGANREACTYQSLQTSPVFCVNHLDDFAVVHVGNSIGKLENACVVGDDYECSVGLFATPRRISIMLRPLL